MIRSTRSPRFALVPWALLWSAIPLAAQTGGAIAGRVRDAVSSQPLEGVLVTVDSGPRGAVTDATGGYRIREVRSGWHRVRASQIGYQATARDSVLVQAAPPSPSTSRSSLRRSPCPR